MIASLKSKKLILTFCLAVLIAGGIFILSASPARAASFWDVMSNPSQIFYVILGLLADFILYIANLFVRVAATLLEFVFGIEKFTGVAVVTAGWKVCRDIANIGFSLVLLVMAFDSVLQLNKYPIKTILPRLVVAALLINFSLVFCGMIIDFSQIMTRYFYDAAVGSNTQGLSGELVDALNIQSIYKEPPSGWGDKVKSDGPGSIIIGMLFGTVILLIAAFSIAAAAIYFIVRMVSLWLLMIFAPIAWISMIVPGAPEIGGYWNKWWGEFLKWSFFAPVYMFFIYLAIMMAKMAPITSSGASIETSLSSQTGFLADGIYKLLQYIAIIIILIGGLKYAQKAGVAGAGAVMKAGKAITNGAKSYAMNKTGISGLKERYGEVKEKYFTAPMAANQAKWATRFGSKSAEERNMKTQAKKMEDTQSVTDIKAAADKGDPNAAYAMSNMNLIDGDTYRNFSQNNKNQRMQKALDLKVGQKRADLVAIKNANEKANPNTSDKKYKEDYQKEYDRIKRQNAGQPGWDDKRINQETQNYIKDVSMREEIGNFSAEKFANQDWGKAEKDLVPGSTDRIRTAEAAVAAYVGMTPEAQAEFRRKISSTQKTALNELAKSAGYTSSQALIV